MEIKKGSKVKVHYSGKLEDGQVFDSSEGREPLEFTAGSRMIIKGFDEAVIGMKEGEEKEINIEPAEAYGDRKEELVQTVPKSAFGDKLDPKEGMQLMLNAPTGQQMPAKITKVEGDNITIDMNHPLCGKKLNFKFNIVSVEEGKPEESKAEEECPGCAECGPECREQTEEKPESEDKPKEKEPDADEVKDALGGE